MLYLVDASVYVFRGWFSIPDTMTDPEGRPVNAAYGYAGFLAGLLATTRPSAIAVAFDESLTSSFRNRIYPDYKANRELPPPELEHQFDLCRRLTRALGVRDFASKEYEADDIIGTLAARARVANGAVTIVSRDKDLIQLLGAKDRFWNAGDDETLATGDVPGRFGVRADQLADYLGLVGDPVDNIPGIPRVGAKTAVALLAHFDTMDALFERLDEVATLPIRGARTLAARLAAHRRLALLSRELATIHCAVPLDLPESDPHRGLRWAGADADAVTRVCEEAGFGAGLRDRMLALAETEVT